MLEKKYQDAKEIQLSLMNCLVDLEKQTLMRRVLNSIPERKRKHTIWSVDYPQ
jgi:hypothetical protein